MSHGESFQPAAPKGRWDALIAPCLKPCGEYTAQLTLHKTNILNPKKWRFAGLEDDFPFQRGEVQVPC